VDSANRRRLYGCAIAASLSSALVVTSTASAALSGFLMTPAASGVVGGGNWAPPTGGQGYHIAWNVSQNVDLTWHYVYTFTQPNGASLSPLTSHVIIQLSETAGEDDLFNFKGDIDKVEFGTYALSSGNPGFPAGEEIFGVKINLAFNQQQIEFDSVRMPMWGDFYSKGGGGANPSFAYNTHLGAEVVNPHDVHGTPVDMYGNPLTKILVPNTRIPEPMTVVLFGLGTLGIFFRERPR
jgi:hypothetical protein